MRLPRPSDYIAMMIAYITVHKPAEVAALAAKDLCPVDEGDHTASEVEEGVIFHPSARMSVAIKKSFHMSMLQEH
nr:hypothetical protein [Micrococcus luteus]